MATKAKTYHFTVEGSGGFPFDMLRYDQCWPHYGLDAGLLAPDRHERRAVVLESCSSSLPTSARWVSFGWRVVGVGILRKADGTLEKA